MRFSAPSARSMSSANNTATVTPGASIVATVTATARGSGNVAITKSTAQTAATTQLANNTIHHRANARDIAASTSYSEVNSGLFKPPVATISALSDTNSTHTAIPCCRAGG